MKLHLATVCFYNLPRTTVGGRFSGATSLPAAFCLAMFLRRRRF